MRRNGRPERSRFGFIPLEVKATGLCRRCKPPTGKRPGHGISAANGQEHTHAPCSACTDRNAITADGRVRVVSGLYQAGKCEVCLGTGQEPVFGKDRFDPYQKAK